MNGYTYYEVDSDDKIYMCVILSCKNVSTANKSASNAASVDVEYAGKYSYSGIQRVPNQTLGFDASSTRNIKPLTTQEIYYIIEMPINAMEESDSAIIVDVNVEGISFKIKYR